MSESKEEDRFLGSGSFGTVRLKNGAVIKTIVIPANAKLEEKKNSRNLAKREVQILDYLRTKGCSDCFTCFLKSSYIGGDEKESSQEKFTIETVYLEKYIEMFEWITKMQTFPGSLNDLIVRYFVVQKLITCFQELERLGVAHRDIKPENLLIKIDRFWSHTAPTITTTTTTKTTTTQENGPIQLRFIDFGLSCLSSKAITGHSFDQCAQENSAGTLEYLAPELLLPQQESPSFAKYMKADKWSLGVTIYAIITGSTFLNDLLGSNYSNYPKIIGENLISDHIIQFLIEYKRKEAYKIWISQFIQIQSHVTIAIWDSLWSDLEQLMLKLLRVNPSERIVTQLYPSLLIINYLNNQHDFLSPSFLSSLPSSFSSSSSSFNVPVSNISKKPLEEDLPDWTTLFFNPISATLNIAFSFLSSNNENINANKKEE